MNEENTKKLYERFSNWFKPDWPPKTSLMAFGFECQDGWFDLIWKLCEDIEKLNPREEFRVVQVKQKFGGLRFYINGARSEKVLDLIHEAEQKSYTTCERCGNKGRLLEGGNWQSLCKECEEKREEEYRKKMQEWRKKKRN